MVEINIEDGKLIVEMTRKAEVGVQRITLPLAHIAGASVDSLLAANFVQRRQMIENFVPEAIKAGRQYEDFDTIFWEIENPQKVIIIYLEEEPYNKLIVEVKEPFSAVQQIENALSEHFPAKLKDKETPDDLALKE